MNMDYAFNEALKYTTNEDTPGVILAYDINCQYSINLRRRLTEGPFLDNREDLPILPAIGLFHVHGHQEQCYARYAPTFVCGMGKGDGEILETNWSVLNGISSMTRTMTLAHRSKVMDAHIGDNNWKKMINMGAFAWLSLLIFAIWNASLPQRPLFVPVGRRSASQSRNTLKTLN